MTAMRVGKIRGNGGVPKRFALPGYSPTASPVFFGHYWVSPKPSRLHWPQMWRVLDYRAGKGGPLVAYRFDGERVLNRDKFVAVK